MPDSRPPGAGLVAARIGAALLLAAGAVAVLRPFVTPMAWAAIAAYTTWPLYRRLRARSRRPRLSAALFTALVTVAIGVPGALILVALADDATRIVQAVGAWHEQGSALPEWLAEQAWVESARAWLSASPIGDPAAAGEWLSRAGGEISRRLVAIAGGIARNALRFAVMLVTLYALYVNGERLAGAGKRLVPLLFPSAPERFFERIGVSVQAVVFGLLGTAIAQGVLAGIGLAVAGVPSPAALGTATALLSFLPGGAGAVSLAAALWLGLGGHLAAAIGLALWAILVVGSVDNVLRPILISERGQIPFLLVFFGVVGGLMSFGLIGLFVGPVLLSVAFTLVSEFSRSPLPGRPGAGGESRPRPADAD